MYDYAPETGRTSVKGFRTKKAKRRAEQRRATHERAAARARKAKARRIKIDRARREEGWWPPMPS